MQSRLTSSAAKVPTSKGGQADFVFGHAPGAQGLENAQPGVSGGAGLAHDAGNLIGALGLYCDLMSRPGVVSPDFQHYLTELRHLAIRGESLIERLLQLDWEQFGVGATGKAQVADALVASVKKSALELQCSVVDPAVALQRLRGLLTRLSGAAVELRVDLRCHDLLLPMEEEALERILVNLTRNAVQAMPEGGYLRICWKMVVMPDSKEHAQGLPGLVLSVQDTGCGMSEREAELFSGAVCASRSVVRSRSAAKGYGLGLSIVRELVTESGGELAIRSQPGAGTLVEMIWPITSTPAAEKESEQEKSFHRRHDKERHSSVKISLPSQGPVRADSFPDRRTDQCS